MHTFLSWFVLDEATMEIVIRLFISLLLGMVIGAERVWAHKTAGMRTYALVAMGSALFVIISNEMVRTYASLPGLNPLMIVAQIVVGVGFIGTGLIFSKDNKLMGLTTATGLWVSAGIGMACGFGLFEIAIISTLFILFIFVVLWFIEKSIKNSKIYKDDSLEDSN